MENNVMPEIAQPAHMAEGIGQRMGRRIGAAAMAAGGAIRSGAENAVAKLRESYDDFHQTIAEGNYHIKPKSLWTLVTGKGREPDKSAPATFVGHAMLDTGRSFGKRMMWASAIALISMQAMVWVAGGLALAGAAMFYLEYAQSRRARNEIITEVNFAGQRVEGTRADLYHLHHAQEQIMNLSSVFKQASLESTSDTILHIMEGVKERAARVRVIESGRYSAGTDRYEFSEPAIKLVNDGPHIHAPVPLAAMSVTPAFNAAQQAGDVVRRMIELENALPPDVQEKLAAARAAQSGTAPKAA